jgi:hypothetical protein
MFLFWVLGAPLIGFFILFLNKERLEDPVFSGYFRMLYMGLKSKIFYWEFCNSIRKFFLILINVFLSIYEGSIKVKTKW